MKRIVRKGMLALAAIVLLNSTAVMAQDSEITDKDLYNFALIMQVIEQMKAEVSPAIQEIIEAQEGFDTNRYSELKSAEDDEAKLRDLGANDFEVQFMTLIIKEKNEKTDAMKEVLNTTVKALLGAQKYKLIKSTISVDPDMKSKYIEITKQIAPADTGA
jgi:hypothetical protein